LFGERAKNVGILREEIFAREPFRFSVLFLPAPPSGAGRKRGVGQMNSCPARVDFFGFVSARRQRRRATKIQSSSSAKATADRQDFLGKKF